LDTDWLVWAGKDGEQFPDLSLVHKDMTSEEVASVQPMAMCIAAAKRRLESVLDDQQALIRVVALSALSEVNLLRSWLAAFKTEAAASVSLADLKTRVAGLPAMPDRTKAQLMKAIVSKLDSGEATP